MVISLRLNEEESRLIKGYSKMQGLSVSEYMRRAALSNIEDEYDIKCYEEALKNYEENPKTYSFEEMEKELGLV